MGVDQKISMGKMSLPQAYKKMHEHPADAPDKIIKQKVRKDGIRETGEHKCCNWGCDQSYEPDRNDHKKCLHHPGRFEFGSEQGLWPEGWTCCRKAWDEEGCTYGNHRGYPVGSQLKFCIAHGEPNPKGKYPDSFCGKAFILDGDNEPCGIHPGNFTVKNKKSGEGVWSCCGEEDFKAAPCQEGGAHVHAEWPEEDAKKYFFDKPVKYPKSGEVQGYQNDFELYGRFSGFFRTPTPYVPKNSRRGGPSVTPDEQKKLDAKTRYCLNWACTKQYKN